MLDAVVEIAMEVDYGYKIDFGSTPIDEGVMFRYTATKIVEEFMHLTSEDERVMMLLAALTCLTVENMVLHMRMQNGN